MKNNYLLIIVLTLVFSVTKVFAQPANDNKINAIELTDFDNWCSSDKAYTTSSGTADEPKPACWNNGPVQNVWFKFTATDTFIKAIVRTGSNYGTMRYAQMAIIDASNNVIACQTYLGSTSHIVCQTNILQ